MNKRIFLAAAVMGLGTVGCVALPLPIQNGVLTGALNANGQAMTNVGSLTFADGTVQSTAGGGGGQATGIMTMDTNTFYVFSGAGTSIVNGSYYYSVAGFTNSGGCYFSTNDLPTAVVYRASDGTMYYATTNGMLGTWGNVWYSGGNPVGTAGGGPAPTVTIGRSVSVNLNVTNIQTQTLTFGDGTVQSTAGGFTGTLTNLAPPTLVITTNYQLWVNTSDSAELCGFFFTNGTLTAGSPVFTNNFGATIFFSSVNSTQGNWNLNFPDNSPDAISDWLLNGATDPSAAQWGANLTVEWAAFYITNATAFNVFTFLNGICETNQTTTYSPGQTFALLPVTDAGTAASVNTNTLLQWSTNAANGVYASNPAGYISAGQANVGLQATFYVTNTAVGQSYSSDDPMLFALMDSYYGNNPVVGWSLLSETAGFATCYNMYLGYVGSYPYASGTIGENGLQGYIFNQHVIGISGDNRMAVSVGNLYGSGGVDGGQVELLARRNASASYLGGWLYAEGIKYDGYSRVQIGNNPQSEHTLWYPGHAYLDLRTGGENTVPAFLFRDEAMVDTPVPGALERGLDGDLYYTRGNGDRVNIATNAQPSASPITLINAVVITNSAGAPFRLALNASTNLIAVPITNTIAFSASPTSGAAPLGVQFSSPSVDNVGANIVGWQWAFGDGTTNYTQNPLHTYSSASTNIPSLIATNAFGWVLASTGPSIVVTNTGSSGTNLLTGLTAYWKLDESSGNAVDASGNGYTQTAYGNVVYGQTGVINTAYKFDGSSAYLYNASIPNNQTDQTVSFWVKMTSGYSGYNSYLVNVGSGDQTLCSQVTSAGNVIVYAGGGASGGMYVSASSALSNLGWHQVVFAVKGTTLSLYIDGVLDGTNFIIVAADTALSIGGLYNHSNDLYGSLDEIGYWSRALTATEISALYNSGSGLPFGSFSTTP